MTAVPEECLEVAREAARRAAAVIRGYYRENLHVKTKADRTPVTVADVESEKVIRRLLERHFPEHGFYGEETGRTNADAEYLWLVDPIDGTKSFVRGYPFFSTQIALLHRGELVLGVSSAPAMEQLVWAVRGEGAYADERPLRVSRRSALGEAAVSTGNLKTLARSAGWAALGGIVAEADRIRGYGDFYHYHLLAAGRIEAVIESDVNILDIAALTVIVREAGGVVTALDGAPVGLETTSVLAANPELHPQLLARLAGNLPEAESGLERSNR